MDLISNYIDQQSEAVRDKLIQIWKTIKNAIPDTEERISYGMPTFWKGRNIIHFAASKKHIGIYPGGETTTAFAGKLTNYEISKGTIRLPLDKEPPLELIAEIAKWCYDRYAK